MTDTEKKELLAQRAIIDALIEGKALEYSWGTKERWFSLKDGARNLDLDPYLPLNFSKYDYRIKASPKMRLIRPTELPSEIWVRHDTWFGSWTKVVAIQEKELYISKINQEPCPESIFIIDGPKSRIEEWFWSDDRKKIKSFYVEE